MRFILVSVEDPTVKQAIDIPKEIVTGVNKTNPPRPAVTKPAEPQRRAKPQKTLSKKSHQSSKSIIHG